jgi:hypothetical protein
MYGNETIIRVNTSLFVVSGATACLLMGITLVPEKTKIGAQIPGLFAHVTVSMKV